MSFESWEAALTFVGSDISVMAALAEYGRPLFGRQTELVVHPLTPPETADMIGLEAADALDAYLVVGGFPLIVQTWRTGVSLWQFLEREFSNPTSPLIVTGERAFAAEFPGVPIVAEESAPSTFEGFRSAEQVFFVDPVDGTNEFVERNDEFVVMIGFVDGPRATHGVILAPVPGTAWAGSTVTPAVEIDREGARSPLRVSNVETLASSRVVSSR